jgi:hypothetical protein
VIIDQYSEFEFFGVKVDGDLTKSENIAGQSSASSFVAFHMCMLEFGHNDQVWRSS